MKTRILLMLCCALILAALFFTTGTVTADTGIEPDYLRYYIVVSVTDLTSTGSNLSSCSNSSGYIVMPTRRQDGSTGICWSAVVHEDDWDHKNATIWYAYNSVGPCSGDPRGTSSVYPVDGIPTELKLLARDDPSYEHYIQNANMTYRSNIRFTVWISTDNRNYTELESWVESTGIHNYWTDIKEVSTSKYAKPWTMGSISFPTDVYIPKAGASENTYEIVAAIYDQYGAR